MEKTGWIRLYRQTLENPIVMKDADYLAVWIYLLGTAVYKETDISFKGKRYTLKPGELSTGRKKIASELKISESKVQRILKSFEIEHQIEQRTDRQCRIISICSWDKYQIDEQRNEQRVNNDRTTSEQRVNTKKEYKNIRIKELKKTYRGLPEDFVEAMSEFKKHRVKLKSPMTDVAESRIANKAIRLADRDYLLASEILYQSIEQGWKGVFPLGTEKVKQSDKGLPYSDIDF